MKPINTQLLIITLLFIVQINTIVQCWVSEHFPDFEGLDQMEDFLDWFELKLVEDVSRGLVGGRCKCRFLYTKTNLETPFYLTPTSLFDPNGPLK